MFSYGFTYAFRFGVFFKRHQNLVQQRLFSINLELYKIRVTAARFD